MLMNWSKFPLEKIKKRIQQSESIVITSHVNPDGDAIGSSLGLLNLFRNMNKECHLLIPNEVPSSLMWMKSADKIIVCEENEEDAKNVLDLADLIFFVDFNDSGRLKNSWRLFKNIDSFKIMIDHHPEPGQIADVIISETSLGSASELVYELIKKMDFNSYVDKNIAECLYTGIMTDTGNFSFACSYPGVWKNIAELIAHGVDRDYVFSKVYDNYSENRMRLMGYCLHEKMKILNEYNAGIISLSMDELDRFHHEEGDTDGFVNLPFSVKGVSFTVLLIEREDHIKLSLRSRGGFSVNDLSKKYFNGGGHRNAAGGELPKPLSKAVETVIGVLSEMKNGLK